MTHAYVKTENMFAWARGITFHKYEGEQGTQRSSWLTDALSRVSGGGGGGSLGTLCFILALHVFDDNVRTISATIACDSEGAPRHGRAQQSGSEASGDLQLKPVSRCSRALWTLVGYKARTRALRWLICPARNSMFVRPIG